MKTILAAVICSALWSAAAWAAPRDAATARARAEARSHLVDCAGMPSPKECREVQAEFVDDWQRAMSGNGEEAANVSFLLREPDAGTTGMYVLRDALQSCAWTMVAGALGSSRGDGNHLAISCGELGDLAREVASQRASHILATIRSHPARDLPY